MSAYLIDRIEASPNIQLATRTEVTELHGDDRLTEITTTDRSTGIATGTSVPASSCSSARSRSPIGSTASSNSTPRASCSPAPTSRTRTGRTPALRNVPARNLRSRRRALRFDEAGRRRGGRGLERDSIGSRVPRTVGPLGPRWALTCGNVVEMTATKWALSDSLSNPAKRFG